MFVKFQFLTKYFLTLCEAIRLLRSVPEFGFHLVSLNEKEFDEAYRSDFENVFRKSQRGETCREYKPMPIIQIAQTANLTNFLSDDIIQVF